MSFRELLFHCITIYDWYRSPQGARLFDMKVSGVSVCLWSYFTTLKSKNIANVQVVSYLSGDMYFFFKKSCIWVLNIAVGMTKINRSWYLLMWCLLPFSKQRDTSIQRAVYNFHTTIIIKPTIGSYISMKWHIKPNNTMTNHILCVSSMIL